MRRAPGLQQHHQRNHDQETDDDHPERPQQSEHLRLQCGFAGDEREETHNLTKARALRVIDTLTIEIPIEEPIERMRL